MNKFFKYMMAVTLFAASAALVSCTNDLDVKSIDPNVTTNDGITPEQLFTKCYACIGVAGNGGANGDSDVDGIDGGTSGYVRQIWNANELTSDEAICGWGDDGISQFDFNSYDATHPMLRGLYYRLYTSIVFCNTYLDQFESYDSYMTAEVRFIRALDYYYLLDMWGNVPFVTTVTTEKPQQYSRSDLFNWLETELTAIKPSLMAPRVVKNGDEGYGRIDQDAANLLLARLYLNAEVYTGTARWAQAEEYAGYVINGVHKLATTGYDRADLSTGVAYTYTPYQRLFMGDNDSYSEITQEAIFPILQDGIRTTSWGTTLFMIASTFDTNMHEDPFNTEATNGTTEHWGGNRTRPDLIDKFFSSEDCPQGLSGYETAQVAEDDRALFNTAGDRTYENVTYSTFTHGYAVAKYTNFKVNGSAGSSSQFPDGDFFFMRSAEAYLTYAEAAYRLGDTEGAKTMVNQIRSRAHAKTVTTLDLDDILDEWAREFYFEGRRRSDLIRFGYYGGNSSYVWQWKGGTYAGRNFESFRNIFAIPSQDLNVNENLTQNPGY